MAQLVRAPPCHGGGRRFESDLGRSVDFMIIDIELAGLVLQGDMGS